jgi:hypothetical protein
MMKCIHGVEISLDDVDHGIECEKCDDLGKSPDYDPNCTIQDLEEILCGEPLIVPLDANGAEK